MNELELNILNYCKKFIDTHNDLCLLLNLFASSTVIIKGCGFPCEHAYLLASFVSQLHELDNRKVTEPETSEHNKFFCPIWQRIDMEVLQPAEKMARYLNSEDSGISEGFKDIGDYTKQLRELEETFKNIGIDIFKRCGYGEYPLQAWSYDVSEEPAKC